MMNYKTINLYIEKEKIIMFIAAQFFGILVIISNVLSMHKKNITNKYNIMDNI